MAFDSDLRDLLDATKKAAPQIAGALERQQIKLRVLRKMAADAKSRPHPPDKARAP